MRAYLGGDNSEFPSKLLQIGNSTIPNDDVYITINKQIGHNMSYCKIC